VHDQLVLLMDLAATTLVVAGLPIPQHMHAQPLFDMHGQPAVPPRRVVFGHRDRMDEQEDTIRTVRDALSLHPQLPPRPPCHATPRVCRPPADMAGAPLAALRGSDTAWPRRGAGSAGARTAPPAGDDQAGRGTVSTYRTG